MQPVTLALVFAVLAGCSAAAEPEARPREKPEKGGKPEDKVTREGDELVGRAAPGWELATWFNSKPLALEELRGKVVLVRWFTSPDCPFCTATAPSLNLLDDRYRARGLVVLGFYHHKNPEPLDPAAVKGYLDNYEFRFPVAIDPDWKTLNRWWLDRERGYTSVSFLLDKTGVIRLVHPGGTYTPGSPDFAAIEHQIQSLLAE